MREIETRIQKTELEHNLTPSIDKPAPSVPENYNEHTRLMFDLMTVAFQTDVTRIVTFMMAIEQSNRAYRETGIGNRAPMNAVVPVRPQLRFVPRKSATVSPTVVQSTLMTQK
ncbi:DUF1552 domain-containing protein [Lacticaseibacillus rhamnosus]